MPTNPGFFLRSQGKLLLMIVGLVFLSSTAQAYTVVLRSGRVVEIPNAFTLNGRMITYEVSPGIQISLQLAAINIPATERANKEPVGSFSRRLAGDSVSQSSARGNERAGTSITNRELESFARARRQSELAYERRRKELGLPSAAESRQRAIVEAELARERSRLGQMNEKSNEDYWRERANALRAEIAATDAEINSTRQELSSMPSDNSLASVSVVTGLAPFATFGQSGVNPFFQGNPYPGVFVAPQNRGAQLRGRINVGPGISRDPRAGVYFGNQPRFRRRNNTPYSVFPNFSAYGYQPYGYSTYGYQPYGYQPYDLSYERTVLITRLNELVANKAGLEARWRALEDEARRAGAYPGWLRP
jgi:hypothetical protein